uniref:Uncharacterized protein n=1 Tax=Peronospora matthiolae TaxID=2874970 RepID=A0AAV1UER9_9STRA
MKCGRVRPNIIANGAAASVTLINIHLTPSLPKHIVFYGKLKRKGFVLVCDEEKRSIARHSDGAVAFEVAME